MKGNSVHRLKLFLVFFPSGFFFFFFFRFSFIIYFLGYNFFFILQPCLGSIRRSFWFQKRNNRFRQDWYVNSKKFSSINRHHLSWSLVKL